MKKERVIVKRRVNTTNIILEVISSRAKRVGKFDERTNCYSQATFDFGCKSYLVLADGRIFEAEIGESFKPVKINWVKSGVYPEVEINGCRIKTYHLVLAALNPDFYEKYMSDGGLVVNHLVVEYKPRQHDFYQSVASPVREYASAPDCLELITSGENIKHGKFVDKYNLYGILIHANEVDKLQKFINNLMDKFGVIPADQMSSFILREIKSWGITEKRDYREAIA